MCVCFGVHASVHLARRTFLISRASGFSLAGKVTCAKAGQTESVQLLSFLVQTLVSEVFRTTRIRGAFAQIIIL